MCGRVPHIIFASTYNSCSTCSGLCTANCVGSTIANSSLTCASNYCASGCSGVCDNKTCTSSCNISCGLGYYYFPQQLTYFMQQMCSIPPVLQTNTKNLKKEYVFNSVPATPFDV